MKKIRELVPIFLLIVLLPINVLAVDNFSNHIISEENNLKGESSIFHLTVDITKEIVNIMDSNRTEDRDEIVKLLNKFLKKHKMENMINSEELMDIYRVSTRKPPLFISEAELCF